MSVLGRGFVGTDVGMSLLGRLLGGIELGISLWGSGLPVVELEGVGVGVGDGEGVGVGAPWGRQSVFIALDVPLGIVAVPFAFDALLVLEGVLVPVLVGGPLAVATVPVLLPAVLSHSPTVVGETLEFVVCGVAEVADPLPVTLPGAPDTLGVPCVTDGVP
jgi:hypothetical protein